MAYDLVIANACVVDPRNGTNAPLSIAIKQGRIEDVTPRDLSAECERFVDMRGCVAVPGIIDPHVHLTDMFGGSEGGFHMLAKAGVCTAVDLAGPSSKVYDILERHGSGITAAVVESVRPGNNISGKDASYEELRALVERSMKEGAIGCKLLGGHYPLTPEASARFVRAANDANAYAAWHAGTTTTATPIDAMREAIELAGDKARLHLAHINSYCRGLKEDATREAQTAEALLLSHPNICSEAYLAQLNGTSFTSGADGRPKSGVTRRCLAGAGYAENAEGIEQALRDGFAHVFAQKGLETGVFDREEGVALFRKCQGATPGGFDVNPALPRLYLCLAKRPDGSFLVDAISTDGGAIPRNVIVSHGLGLVAMGMMTLEEFILKTSVTPAKLLGLRGKGHLSPGADADVTVLDLDARAPVMTVARGEICMFKGYVTGRGGAIVTTARGLDAVKARGIATCLVDEADFLPPHEQQANG